MLPIASWERRFIGKEHLVDTAEGDTAEGDTAEGDTAEGDDTIQRLNAMAEADDSSQDGVEFGGGENGGGGSADDFYGMMLMSSTHHRFSGLFTIRKPGAPPVTQLLVRGSPA